MLRRDEHARVQDKLSEYLDGQMTAREAESLESHIAGCADCRGALDEMRAAVAALRLLPPVAVPRSFVIKPEQAGQRRPVAARGGLGATMLGMRLAGAAVAVALVVTVFVDMDGLQKSGNEERSASVEVGYSDSAEEKGAIGSSGAERGPEQRAAGTPAPAAAGAGAPETSHIGTGDSAVSPTTPMTPPSDFGSNVAPTQSPSALASREQNRQSEDGVDGLRFLQIALAASLGLLVAGYIALALRGRKR